MNENKQPAPKEELTPLGKAVKDAYELPKVGFEVAVKKLTGDLSNYRPPIKKPSFWETIKRINKSTTIKMPYWENIKRIANTNVIKTDDINKLVSPVVRKAALYTFVVLGAGLGIVGNIQDNDFQKQYNKDMKAVVESVDNAKKENKTRLFGLEDKVSKYESENKARLDNYQTDLDGLKEAISNTNKSLVDLGIANKDYTDAKYLGLEKVVSNTDNSLAEGIKANELSTKELGKVVDDFYKEFVSFKDGFAKKPVKEEPKPLPEQKIATPTATTTIDSWFGYIGQKTKDKTLDGINVGFSESGENKIRADFYSSGKDEKTKGNLTTFTNDPAFTQRDNESFKTERIVDIKSVDASGKIDKFDIYFQYAISSDKTKDNRELDTNLVFTNPLILPTSFSTDVQTKTKIDEKTSLINVNYNLGKNCYGGLVSKIKTTDVEATSYVNNVKVIDYNDRFRTNGTGISFGRNIIDNSVELSAMDYTGDGVDKKDKSKNIDYAAHYAANLKKGLDVVVGLDNFDDKSSYKTGFRFGDDNGTQNLGESLKLNEMNKYFPEGKTKEQMDFYFLNSMLKKGTGFFAEKGDKKDWKAIIESDKLGIPLAAGYERYGSDRISSLGAGADLSDSVTIGLYGQQTNYHQKLNNERIKKDNLIGINFNVKLGKGKGK